MILLQYYESNIRHLQSTLRLGAYEFDMRLQVKAGLTGYAQIAGKYNTTPKYKLVLDLMYIENYSLILDIKLILMTLQIMLRPESTEGFDKAEELKQKADNAISEIESSDSNNA